MGRAGSLEQGRGGGQCRVETSALRLVFHQDQVEVVHVRYCSRGAHGNRFSGRADGCLTRVGTKSTFGGLAALLGTDLIIGVHVIIRSVRLIDGWPACYFRAYFIDGSPLCGSLFQESRRRPLACPASRGGRVGSQGDTPSQRSLLYEVCYPS